MAIGSNLLQSGMGNTLMSAFNGPLGQYAQRPASGTNLPRTMMSNMRERLGGTTTQMSYNGPSGPAVPIQYSGSGPRPSGQPVMPSYMQQAPSPASQITTTREAPALTRFVPFTGANGQSTFPGAGGAGGAQGGGLFGGGGGGLLGGLGGGPQGGAQGGVGGQSGGDYRTLLAQLFPTFRGEGYMDRAVSDYFSGPTQPSFAQQFGYLA